jgi:hypothetical protein
MDRLELSSAAREVLNDGFRRNLASREIAQLIRQRTGEAVSGRTVRRRVLGLVREREQRAGIRERVGDFVEAMKDADWHPAEVVLSLVFGLMVASPEDRIRLASEALAGHRPGRAAVPESEWEGNAWQIVRRLRGKLIRGENLNLADAEELGAICKLRGAKNEGGGNEKVFARQSGCGPD